QVRAAAEERLALVSEEPVEGALVEARAAGDFGDGGLLEAALAEQLAGGRARRVASGPCGESYPTSHCDIASAAMSRRDIVRGSVMSQGDIGTHEGTTMR